MCGLAGFCDFSKKSNQQILEKMTDVLHHRGPDDSGYFFEENTNAQIALGHRRLSILDLSNHGHQPMQFQNLEIVYNGEVYNFKEIQAELIKLGYAFESESDTEVILKAYHAWGVAAVDKFNGMFVIVIYDKAANKIIIIRDRAGVKPLFYSFQDKVFLFASELKSFHQHPRFVKKLNKDALPLYFKFGYILEPHTIFEDCFKLKAGHYLKLNLKSKKLNEHKYWDIIDVYNQAKCDISFTEAKRRTHEHLKKACEYRMVADVPVGIFLSGGYDSTAVTAILQKNRSQKLKTFTIGFEQQKFNEAHDAKKIAKHLGTDHKEYYCTQKDALEILPTLPEIWDEPMGDSSAIPTILVSRLAKQDVKVSLSADGGDEVFGGYKKYLRTIKYHRLFGHIPKRKHLAKLLSVIPAKKLPFKSRIANFDLRFNKVKDLLAATNHIEMMNESVYYFREHELNKMLSDQSSKSSKLPTYFDDYNNLNDLNDPIAKMMAIDFKTFQLDDILTKVDRATMSVSLEGREPFLDYQMIEFVASLPSHHKIYEGKTKHILKSIVHDYIPKAMMDREKQGFSVPLKHWFGDELKKYVLEYLEPQKLAKTGVFNIIEIEQLKQEWLESDKHVMKIWLILIFMMWHEKWMF